jgi:alpha-L-fucosidase
VGKPATASSVYSTDYGPANAVDGNLKTRWAAKLGTTNAWLEVDLGQPAFIDRALISEIEWEETREFVLEAKDGETWKELARGAAIGSDLQLEFPAIRTRVVRLRIVKCERGANINEFQLFGHRLGRQRIDKATVSE